MRDETWVGENTGWLIYREVSKLVVGAREER
jgi:hypothetical protein